MYFVWEGVVDELDDCFGFIEFLIDLYGYIWMVLWSILSVL